MQMLVCKGVDFTPFISHKGYKCTIEDLDASGERSMNGSLTRDRVARIPTIEVSIVAGLLQADVQRLINACKSASMLLSYFNVETNRIETGLFYSKINYPQIYSTSKNQVRYEGFTIKFIAFYGVNYA